MEKYTHKYKPGQHYVIAHEELASIEYGVACLNDQGNIIGSGTIAKSQVQWFIDNNFYLTERKFLGKRCFLVSQSKLNDCIYSFNLLEDIWISEQINKTFDMQDLFVN